MQNLCNVMDYEKDKAKNKVAILDKKSYFDSYYENQVKIYRGKIYRIKIKKRYFHCIQLQNADECSVRFTGYITLFREF